MAILKRPMYSPHNPKGPTVGKDVAIAKFAVGRYEDNLLPKPAGGYTNTFGPALYDALHTVIQPREHIEPTGDIGQATWDVLWNYLDAYRRWQYRLWKVPAPSPPPLIEPKQGFDSLVKFLWDEYSLGRSMGLTDLGTYNPASTLPGGGKSDHAYYPSYAFDLGFTPQTGWDNLTARSFFNKMVARQGIHYVILGDKIWSTERGLHAYTDGGHEGHVHTSGIH